MKIDEISVNLINQALDLYIKVAFSGLPPKIPPPRFDADGPDSIKKHLDSFENESNQMEGPRLRRFVMRLGNIKYPFMKFVLQEHLIQDEFILLVDTHDDMFDIPTPEFEDLRKIRQYNREIKSRIESLWAKKKIPTLTSLISLIENSVVLKEQRERNAHAGKTILVVDDEPEMGDTLEALLKAGGFLVERLYDGKDAVEQADPERHTLIIMDNDMKIMDGHEACDLLKESPGKSSIPIMIASAGNIDIAKVHRAEAYLAKPFHMDSLFDFIDHILNKDA